MNPMSRLFSLVATTILCGALAPLYALQSGLGVNLPVSLKGEQHSGFGIGPIASYDLGPKFRVDGELYASNVQTISGTEWYIGLATLGRYTVWEPMEKTAVDAVFGIEGNGFSGVGFVVGGVGRYSFDKDAEVRGSLSINTNQDVLFKLHVVKDLKMPDLFGKFGQPAPVVAQVPAAVPPQPVVPIVEPIKPKEVAVEPVADKKPETPVIKPNVVLVPVTYKDIATHWAKQDIEWVASRGIFGQSDKFNPNGVLNKFAAESLFRRSAGFLGVPVKDNQLPEFNGVVTKKDITTAILKAIVMSRGTAVSDATVTSLRATLGAPTNWLDDTDKAVTRAEAAVVVSKLLQAATK